MKRFNIRVYGIIINDNNELLVADEERNGVQFTKFPGGGLEFGEGTIDCLKRECMEELNQTILNLTHFYTTDFYQTSAFNKKEQLLSIYYKVELQNINDLDVSSIKFNFKEKSDEMIALRWLSLHELSAGEVTFPIDKKVIIMLKDEINKR